MHHHLAVWRLGLENFLRGVAEQADEPLHGAGGIASGGSGWLGFGMDIRHWARAQPADAADVVGRTAGEKPSTQWQFEEMIIALSPSQQPVV